MTAPAGAPTPKPGDVWYSDPNYEHCPIERLVVVRITKAYVWLVHPLHKDKDQVRTAAGRSLKGTRYFPADSDRGRVLEARYVLQVFKRGAVQALDRLARNLQTKTYSVATYRHVMRICQILNERWLEK